MKISMALLLILLMNEFQICQSDIMTKDYNEIAWNICCGSDGMSDYSTGGLESARSDFDIRVEFDQGFYGLIAADGTWVLAPQFEQILDYGVNSWTLVQKNGFWGAIDEYGNIIIEPQFKYLSDFNSEGIALVKKDGLCGYITLSGDYIIMPHYIDAEEAYQGVAPVSEDGELWGFIDIYTEEYLIEPRFTACESFINGYCEVAVRIDEEHEDDGTFIERWSWDDIYWHNEWGLVSPDCKVLIEPYYGKIQVEDDGAIYCWKNGTVTVFRIIDNKLVQIE